MSEKFKYLILNDWHGSGLMTDSLNSLKEIILSCYNLGEERVCPNAIHFENKATDTSTSLFITDGTPCFRFEFNDSTSEFFNIVFKNTGLTYDQLPMLDGNDMPLVMDIFSDDYNVRKQNLIFTNFASAGGFFLSVHLDSADENLVDLIAYLLSQYSLFINKQATLEL